MRNRPLPDHETIASRATTPTSRQIAITMAQAALDVKAEELVILDLRKLSFSFDFFVILSAASDRRIQTIADEIREKLSSRGVRPPRREGEAEGGWVLLDDGAVVAHIFAPELREFYGLERLWADAPHVRLPKKRHR